MRRVIHDSDEDEDFDLAEGDNDTADLSNEAPHSSPDELIEQLGTGSTDKLLKQAQDQMIQGNSPCPESPKRNGGGSDMSNRTTNTSRRLADRMGQKQSIWDVPRSPTRSKAGNALADERAERWTSSEIRRKYDGTPTEAATSSTSNPEKVLLELSKSTLGSGVSFDGPGPAANTSGDVQDTDHRSPRRDSSLVLMPPVRLAGNVEQPRELPSITKTSKRRRDIELEEQKRCPSENLSDSDELETGLPKEMYMPRPSRRRTKATSRTSVPTAGLDGSLEIAPDRRSRSSKRRKKENADESALKDGVAHLVDMGFPPGKARECLRQVDGDVERATDMLLQGSYHEEEHEEESAARCEDQPTSKGTQIHEAQFTDAASMCSGTKSPSKTPQTSTSKSRVAKNRRGRPKKSAPPVSSELAQFTDSQIHADSASMEMETLSERQTEDTAEKDSPAKLHSPRKKTGRGRGRPRKSGQSPIACKEIVADDKEDSVNSADEAKSTSDREKVDDSIQNGKVVELSRCTESKLSQDDDKENQPVTDVRAPTGSVDTTAPLSTSTGAAKEVKVESASVTPGGNGRVPHRVGLSKRVRMPSLLRVVRKPH